MKVLLVGPRGVQTFWSMNHVVRCSGRKALLPPLGLLTVAALLPREWECRLVDLQIRPVSAELWDWADLVMVSGNTAQRNGMLAVIREAKQRGKTVVAGGPYPSLLPEAVRDAGADIVVVGEAEAAMPGLLAAIAAGSRGVIVHEDGKPDLSLSPVPRFELLELDAYLIVGVQTSRGCPFACEFCDIAALNGRTPRQKASDMVLKELDHLYKLGWRGFVFFSDDNFIGNRPQAKLLLEQMRTWNLERGEPFAFWTQASVNLGHDPEMIDLMTAANFNTVFIGIESPDGEVLRQTRKFHNADRSMVDAVRSINANGLSVIGGFILGFDGEQKGTGERIRAFIEETNLPVVVVNPLQAVPRTPLWERLERENRLRGWQDGGSISGVERLNFTPMRPESDIYGEIIDLTSAISDPASFLGRAYNYYLAMRPTRSATPSRNGRPPAPESSRVGKVRNHSLDQFRGFASMIWRQGVRAKTRRQFWRQLAGIYRRNPSRMAAYLNTIALGENLREFQSVLGQELQP